MNSNAASILQQLKNATDKTSEQFRHASNQETEIPIDQAIMQINVDDAGASIKNHEEFIGLAQTERDSANPLPDDLGKSIAFNYFRLEKWAEAVGLLLGHTTDEPHDVEALYALGCCYIKLKDFKNATQCFETCTVMANRSSFAFHKWGQACAGMYRETKELDYLKQSVDKYRQAIERNANHHEAFHDWANALEHIYYETDDIADLKLALDKYDAALSIKPDYAQAHNNMCYSLIHLYEIDHESGTLDSALLHARRAVEHCPDGEDYCYNLACAYALKQMKSEMLAALKESIVFDAKHKQMAREDRDFTKYFNDPDFIALTDK